MNVSCVFLLNTGRLCVYLISLKRDNTFKAIGKEMAV